MDNTTTSALRDQILQECHGMAQYAFASGLHVPPSVVQTIEAFAAQLPDEG